MTVIAVNPFQMRDCTLKLGDDQYEAHVSSAKFTPNTPTAKWKGLTPTSVFTFQGTSDWVCELTYAQDIKTADALALFLHEHEGESIPCEFIPKNGTGEGKVTATIIIAPGAIGGKVDDVAESTVTLGVSGKPVIGTVGP